jgi:hypothetical protein
MCGRVSHNSPLIALLLSPILLFASTRHEITVEGASTQKKVALVNAVVGNTRFELTCDLSERHCRIPKTGRYFASESKPDEGIYEDCPNINLYDRSDDGQQGPLIGTYCLLGATDLLNDPKH